MTVYENNNYKITVVDNPSVEEELTFPKLYVVTNVNTLVDEVYETMLPKALAYAEQANDAVKHTLDGPSQLLTASSTTLN